MLTLKYTTNWITELHKDSDNTKKHGNKLRTYRKFKTTFAPEPYLDILVDRNLRRHYARLRTSAHKLHIETGRFTKTAPEQRICQMCTSGEVEDETHFLTTCHMHQTDRNKLYEIVQNSCTNFRPLNNSNKMIWLLSAEQPDIVCAVAKFIKASMQNRIDHGINMTTPVATLYDVNRNLQRY